MGELKPGWRRVKFGDVVRQVKDRVDPAESGLERYIAGEHMDTDDLRIRRWGEIGDDYLGPAFHMRFRPGQVLYGSRRTYLRKIAVPDFEGICANTTFVLESADPTQLLPELLPFVMQTESFHAHSVRESKGSVNPYVNFSDLAWYDFALPPLDEQRRLVEAFRTAEDGLNRVVELRDATRTVFAATLSAIYTQNANSPTVSGSPHYRTAKLSDITTKIVDGVHRRPEYVAAGVPFVTVENLTRGRGIDFESVRCISPNDHETFSKRAPVSRGDVLVSKDGTLGVARVVETDRPFSIFVSVALLKPRQEVVDPWYLRYFFDSSAFLRIMATKTSGSALKHIHLVDFRATRIPLPPVTIQQEHVSTMRALDAAANAAEAQAKRTMELKSALLRSTGLDAEQ